MQALGTEPHLSLLHQLFDRMVRTLAAAVGDLGRHTAGDSCSLSCRDEARRNPDGLPAPAGGRKEYTDADGVVTRVHEWFGYKLHLLVDVKHEVSLDYRVSSTRRGDNEELGALIVHIGLATLLAATPRKEGTLGRMKLSPIARTLQERLHL